MGEDGREAGICQEMLHDPFFMQEMLHDPFFMTPFSEGSDRNIGYTTTGDMGNTFSGCVGDKRPTKTEKVRTSYLVGRYGVAT